ncbi:uncharacterized protein LOC103506327 [Diaphorina citri]|uniref:Uncharacterized protein LOC103506327 n=1 Tax=Diaphorina citri TaxID=121845 RepID=A0A3Q0ILR1_DIACI|nr:uncharacterized protein LOC103506327 [Diaphorina citri]
MHWFDKHLLIFNPNVWYFLFGVWFLSWLWRRRKLYYISWCLPGPTALPIIGNLLYVLRFGASNVYPISKILVAKYGGVNGLIRFWIGPELAILVTDASVASQVNALALTKAEFYQHLAPPYMKTGIFVDEDIDHWRASRKIVTQVLHFKLLKTYIPIFHDESLILVDKFKKYAKNGQSFHPPKFLVLATFSTIMRTMLGVNINAQNNEKQPFIEAVHYCFEVSYVYVSCLYYIWTRRKLYYLSWQLPGPLPLPILGSTFFVWFFGVSNVFPILKIAFRHYASMKRLSKYLARTQVYEETVQILGEDTSVCPTYEDLMKLDYLERVIKECLRLFPAALGSARKITEDIKVTCSNGEEYVLPTGVTVFVLLFCIQKSSQYYDHPDEFDPDRWLPERSEGRDPLSYAPFSSGPRNCIGGKYALLQLKLFSVAIIREFEILPTENFTTLRDVEKAISMNATMDLEEKYLWQQSWNSIPVSNKLKSIKPTISPSSDRQNRYEELVICRMRIGHTRATHRHLFQRAPPSTCRCGEILSVRHILTCALHGMFVDKDIPHWKASKKVITQVFVFKVLKQYIKIFHEESIILVNKLQELAYSGQPFYPPKCLELATFNSIMRTTLGVNPNAQINEHQPFIDALHNIFQHFQRKLFLPILRNNFVYSLFGWRQDEERNIGILLDLAHTVLEDLKTDMKNTTDIMRESRTSLAELLLQQPHISMEELKAQIVTVIGAGLDTSMIQNSMVLIMLATHPTVQEKVFEEMVQVLGEDINVLPSYEDLMKLEYLERVIKECLRMYPAAPFTGRHITEDIKVTTEDGKEYIFPAGVAVGNLLNLVQKSPDYYENPRVFDPDRWLPENSVNRNPHCYIPFSSGPRNCIGGKYAILQMRTMLSAILRKYKVLPSESCKSLRDVRVKMNLTMELNPQCQITLRHRKSE